MRHIRKGRNTITLPYPIKTTEPILARWMREVESTLKNLRDRIPEAPISPLMGSGGSKIPFKVSVSKADDVYYATVAAGYVRVKNPASVADPVVQDFMPTMGGTPLNQKVDGAPPKTAIENGDTVYCHFQTDKHGIISATPTIEVSGDEVTTHYQPDPDGVDGDYWLKIASVSITDGVVKITQFQAGSPLELVPNLLNYEQIGGGRKVIKERDQATDKLKVRTLKEKASDPQVKIIEEDEYIEIKGNGYENSITSARKTSISVKDGLVTSLNYDDSPDAGGIYAVITLNHTPAVGSTQQWTWTYEGGVLVGFAGDGVTGDGTALSPYNVSIVINDTDT